MTRIRIFEMEPSKKFFPLSQYTGSSFFEDLCFFLQRFICSLFASAIAITECQGAKLALNFDCSLVNRTNIQIRWNSLYFLERRNESKLSRFTKINAVFANQPKCEHIWQKQSGSFVHTEPVFAVDIKTIKTVNSWYLRISAWYHHN